MLSGAVPSLSLSAAVLQLWLSRMLLLPWCVETSGSKSCSLHNRAKAVVGVAVMLLRLGQGEVECDEVFGSCP